MRRRLSGWLAEVYRSLQPAPNYREEYRATSAALAEAQAREDRYRADYMERAAELVEAKQMAGAGPWLVHEARGQVNTPGARLREATPLDSQGAYGDLELALQNVEWRRQVNLSWLEFSRWGIQQIILISRLYYLKNPICRRLVDVCAAYVFARGVEVTTNDDAANETLKEFFERNKCVLGQNALVAHERSKDTDGNLFFVFFADKADKGLTTIRTIDATEIADIICDPDDADTPWYYRRTWDQRTFDAQTGVTAVEQKSCWYPALDYDPAEKIPTINTLPVMWDCPVLHRKTGAVAKWHFGCPRLYPMLDWAREARRFLEACASVRQSLSQFALTLTTKGGQQALEGVKAQMSTTVGPTSQIWDQNPPAGRGSTFASGPGTKLEAFKTTGAGFSPEDVRQYKLMCAMVKGVPETFLGDVSTGNLATATSLDRPTETMFLELQEAWREDLQTIAGYVLDVSKGAPSGALRESRHDFPVRECARKARGDGRRVYEAMKPSKDSGDIEIQVNFPNIREGDVPALVQATVEAMTLGNKFGQIAGIDEKEGVKLLYDYLGVEDGEALAELQYPEGTYEQDRAVQKQAQAEDAAKIAQATGTGDPQQGGKQTSGKQTAAPVKKIEAAAHRLVRALKVLERNGHKREAEDTGYYEEIKPGHD
jgi:hypothetical protein